MVYRNVNQIALEMFQVGIVQEVVPLDHQYAQLNVMTVLSQGPKYATMEIQPLISNANLIAQALIPDSIAKEDQILHHLFVKCNVEMDMLLSLLKNAMTETYLMETGALLNVILSKITIALEVMRISQTLVRNTLKLQLSQ